VLLAQMVGLPRLGWTAVGLIVAAVLVAGLIGLLTAAPLSSGHTLDARALYAMSPGDFERFVASVFAASGYTARVMGGSGDGGVDVRVWRDGWCGVVQCKRYRPDRLIGPAIIRELVGTRSHERARFAWLATTASLSPAARLLAEDEGVMVLDAQALTARRGGIAARRPSRWRLPF
jgi:HJR/Mrr/RecB family endonuclease